MKTKESMSSLFNGAGDLVASDREKAEVLRCPFCLIFHGKVCPQASQFPENPSRACGGEAVATVEEESLRNHLTHLDIHKPNGIRWHASGGAEGSGQCHCEAALYHL